MGKYQGYQKYKDSGVEWLGEIPEHWKISKAKFVAEIFIPQRNKPELNFDNGLPWLTMDDMLGDRVSQTKFKVAKEASRKAGSKTLNKGSVIASCIGNFGVCTINDVDVIINQQLQAFIPNSHIITEYLRELVKISSDYFQMIATAATVVYVNQAGFANMPISLPPLDEQKAIAHFLDHKTRQIDDLIAKKETLIEKLDEKRTALITHAVTKGLDPSVPMKDSGIEWLGEIPEYWKAVRLKHITSRIIDGAHFTPTYVDEGIPFLRVTDIVQAKNNSIDMNNIKFIPEEEHKILSIRCKPEQGDLLYSKNGTIGVSRIIDWDFEFSIFVSLCLIKLTKKKVNVEFLQYSLLGKLTETQISIGAKSNTVTNLHLDKIKEFLIYLPTLDEQRKIIQYLDQKTAKIDQQKAKIQEAIELLKEYRTSLITNTVTGKIDVRQVAIP